MAAYTVNELQPEAAIRAYGLQWGVYAVSEVGPAAVGFFYGRQEAEECAAFFEAFSRALWKCRKCGIELPAFDVDCPPDCGECGGQMDLLLPLPR